MSLAPTACTQDFGQFDFTAGGGGAVSATVGAGGTGTGGAPGTGGGVTGATGVGGSTASGTPDEVPCGSGGPCDVMNGESCCVPADGAPNGECKSSCSGNEAALDCNEPVDCASDEECCLDLSGGTQESRCTDSCGDAVLCDPAAPICDAGESCVQHPSLPAGYFYCN